MILRKRRVLVVNPMYLTPADAKRLAKQTRLTVVFDQTIKNGFEVKEIE